MLLLWKKICEESVGTPGTETSAKQAVLDVAVVDRSDFVEICCSDAPCLTEAMQKRGISSSSLLRSDGVGNHDAQTREKLLGWFSEKRPRKAWF